MNLLPPPVQGPYDSLDGAIASLNVWAALQGYAIVKSHTKTYKEQPYRAYIGCDRRGRPRKAPVEPLRQGASRATGCPFSGLFRYDEGLWSLELRVVTHNPPPSDPIAHPTHRRLPPEALGHVATLSSANDPPRSIISSLRLGAADVPQAAAPPVARDVYNARSALRLRALGGRTPIQALMTTLEGRDDWTYKHRSDETGRILGLFLAHRESIDLLQGSPEVLVMDCTYKTNKFRMPLFVVTGVGPLSTTFFVGFAFLSQERQSDYEWALGALKGLYDARGLGAPATLATDRDLGLMGAIRAVFPGARHVLCLWHVAKNVVARCKRYFRSDEAWDEFFQAWGALLRSATVDAYFEALGDFRVCFAGAPQAVAYLERTWLPYKESLIKAWTDRAMHFGVSTTSRVEGAHSALKGYLQISTGDLQAVVDRIGLLLTNQGVEARAAKARARTRIGGDLRVPLFVDLLGVASPVALRLLLGQRRRLLGEPTPELPPCRGVFRRAIGLPCAHEFADRERTGVSLQPSELHPYWLLERSHRPVEPVDPLLLLRDPPVATPKGRPKGARGGSRGGARGGARRGPLYTPRPLFVRAGGRLGRGGPA